MSGCDPALHTSSFKIPIGQNKTENKSYDQLLTTKDTIEVNRQDNDEKIKKPTEDLTEMIASMMDHIMITIYLIYKKDSPKAQYPTTVVPDNKKAPPLEGVHYKTNW